MAADHKWNQTGGGHGVDSSFGGGEWWAEACSRCGMTRRGRRRSGAQRPTYTYEADAYYEARMANPLAQPDIYTYSCDQFRDKFSGQPG